MLRYLISSTSFSRRIRLWVRGLSLAGRSWRMLRRRGDATCNRSRRSGITTFALERCAFVSMGGRRPAKHKETTNLPEKCEQCAKRPTREEGSDETQNEDDAQRHVSRALPGCRKMKQRRCPIHASGWRVVEDEGGERLKLSSQSSEMTVAFMRNVNFNQQ